jgi:hypothetical protein
MLGGLAQSQPVGNGHKGPLINGEKTLFRKITKRKQAYIITNRCRGDPTTQIISAARQVSILGTPRADLRLARGLRPLGQISASLEGYPHPRADLRLARGLPAPSGGSPPRSRTIRALPLEVLWVRKPRTHSSDRSIKRSDMPQAPESKANPRHDGPLTPPGNHTPTLFRQPSLRGHPCHCTGLCSKASVYSVTLCHPLPYGLRTAPLETGWRNP